ncbi:MAG: hypothetical protein KF782_19530, partial [Labilithrix sp.]|nr:hypothetical protein [Labilithrix sp.]
MTLHWRSSGKGVLAPGGRALAAEGRPPWAGRVVLRAVAVGPGRAAAGSAVVAGSVVVAVEGATIAGETPAGVAATGSVTAGAAVVTAGAGSTTGSDGPAARVEAGADAPRSFITATRPRRTTSAAKSTGAVERDVAPAELCAPRAAETSVPGEGGEGAGHARAPSD